ncbi:MAG: hypothetical protein ACTSPY_14600 [Candidatus Helarchaeota archaeon]
MNMEESNSHKSGTGKNEKLLKKALDEYSKGEKLVFKRKFKSAEGFFKKSINNFMKLNDKIRGEKVLLKLAECYLIEKQYLSASESMRDAANLRLMDHKFINAIEHYKSSFELLLKLEQTESIIIKLLEIISFISLCYLAVGDFEKSIDYLKRNIKRYGKNLKNKEKIKLLRATTTVNNLIIQKDIKKLAELKIDITKLNLKQGETELINRIYEILNVYINSNMNLKITEKQIRAGDEFTIIGSLISMNGVKIKSVDLSLDHGFRLIMNPRISENGKEFNSKLISKISGDFKIIINLICSTEEYDFPLTSKKIIKISEGYPIIQFFPSMENLTTNLEQPIPIKFVIKNIGRGEATNLKLKLELPPTIKLIEGTDCKQLYSLAPQEEFSFLFNFKGIVLGKHQITAKLSYEGINKSDSFSDIIKEINIEVISE